MVCIAAERTKYEPTVKLTVDEFPSSHKEMMWKSSRHEVDSNHF